MIKAIKHFEYIFIPKHYYVMCQGDQSNYFFGIVNGKVAIRERKKINYSKFSEHKNKFRTKSKYSCQKKPWS